MQKDTKNQHILEGDRESQSKPNFDLSPSFSETGIDPDSMPLQRSRFSRTSFVMMKKKVSQKVGSFDFRNSYKENERKNVESNNSIASKVIIDPIKRNNSESSSVDASGHRIIAEENNEVRISISGTRGRRSTLISVLKNLGMENLQKKNSTKQPREGERGLIFKQPLNVLENMFDSKIPPFFEECLQYVENQGIKNIGIYRETGFSQILNDLTAKVEEFGGKAGFLLDWEKSQRTKIDVNSVASLVKKFLREISDDFIGSENLLNLNFDEADEKNIEFVKKVLDNLPFYSRLFLDRTITHLRRVNDFKQINYMNYTNLSIIFGPNIIKEHQKLMTTMEYKEIYARKSKILHFLLRNSEHIIVENETFQRGIVRLGSSVVTSADARKSPTTENCSLSSPEIPVNAETTCSISKKMNAYNDIQRSSSSKSSKWVKIESQENLSIQDVILAKVEEREVENIEKQDEGKEKEREKEKEKEQEEKEKENRATIETNNVKCEKTTAATENEYEYLDKKPSSTSSYIELNTITDCKVDEVGADLSELQGHYENDAEENIPYQKSFSTDFCEQYPTDFSAESGLGVLDKSDKTALTPTSIKSGFSLSKLAPRKSLELKNEPFMRTEPFKKFFKNIVKKQKPKDEEIIKEKKDPKDFGLRRKALRPIASLRMRTINDFNWNYEPSK